MLSDRGCQIGDDHSRHCDRRSWSEDTEDTGIGCSVVDCVVWLWMLVDLCGGVDAGVGLGFILMKQEKMTKATTDIPGGGRQRPDRP